MRHLHKYLHATNIQRPKRFTTSNAILVSAQNLEYKVAIWAHLNEIG